MHGIVCTLQKEVANSFVNAFTWVNIFIYLLNDIFLKKHPLYHIMALHSLQITG